MSSFVEWFSKIEWTSWDSFAAFGQWFGGIVTLTTVWFLWKQTEASLKQTQLAVEQMEESRKREKELIVPKVKINIETSRIKEKLHLGIFLSNMKPTQVYIHDYRLSYHKVDQNKKIDSVGYSVKNDSVHTEIPEKITAGDVCITHIPIKLLCELFEEGDTYKFFVCYFYIATGEVIKISILIEKGNYTMQTPIKKSETYSWCIYACQEKVTSIEEMVTKQNKIALVADNYIYSASFLERNK